MNATRISGLLTAHQQEHGCGIGGPAWSDCALKSALLAAWRVAYDAESVGTLFDGIRACACAPRREPEPVTFCSACHGWGATACGSAPIAYFALCPDCAGEGLVPAPHAVNQTETQPEGPT